MPAGARLSIDRDLMLAAFAEDPSALRRLEGVFEKPANRGFFGRGNRLVTVVTGLRPDAPLTDDVLSFVPALMREWMAAGARKAEEVIERSPFVDSDPAVAAEPEREHGERCAAEASAA